MLALLRLTWAWISGSRVRVTNHNFKLRFHGTKLSFFSLQAVPSESPSEG